MENNRIHILLSSRSKIVSDRNTKDTCISRKDEKAMVQIKRNWFDMWFRSQGDLIKIIE